MSEVHIRDSPNLHDISLPLFILRLRAHAATSYTQLDWSSSDARNVEVFDDHDDRHDRRSDRDSAYNRCLTTDQHSGRAQNGWGFVFLLVSDEAHHTYR